jgi:hypothetical protein
MLISILISKSASRSVSHTDIQQISQLVGILLEELNKLGAVPSDSLLFESVSQICNSLEQFMERQDV